MKGYGRAVRKILIEAGCKFLRQGRGDHEIWTSPHAHKPFGAGDHCVPTHGEEGAEGCRPAQGILSSTRPRIRLGFDGVHERVVVAGLKP